MMACDGSAAIRSAESMPFVSGVLGMHMTSMSVSERSSNKAFAEPSPELAMTSSKFPSMRSVILPLLETPVTFAAPIAFILCAVLLPMSPVPIMVTRLPKMDLMS